MEEIGRRLREARVARGITLQEVEEETRIRKKYIEALESGRTVLIPGEVYVKGFLRTYGNFLGLDGEALVQEYKERKSRAEAPEEENGSGPAEVRSAEAEVAAASPDEPRATHQPRPPAFVQAPRRSSRSRTKRRQRGPGPGVYIARRILVALIVIVPLAGLGYWLWTEQAAAPPPQQGGTDVQQPGSDTPPSSGTPEPEPGAEPELEPPTPPEPPKPVITVGKPVGDEVDITISASPIDLKMDFKEGYPWLAVYGASGEELFSAKASGPLSFQGEGFRVRIGFVAGLQLTLNGEPVEHGLEGGPYWINFKSE